MVIYDPLFQEIVIMNTNIPSYLIKSIGLSY